MRHWPACLLAGVMTFASAQWGDSPYGVAPNTFDDKNDPWQERETEPPAFPRQENLLEFYVSAVTTNTYFIDASTLAVGADGVVRYVLVVRTSGGATNISFEGIHCQERRWKLYATGRGDGRWTKSRATRIEWKLIENTPVNRYHAALSRDLFCPNGVGINSADEGRHALRLGKHPNSN